MLENSCGPEIDDVVGRSGERVPEAAGPVTCCATATLRSACVGRGLL
jgi:hypothetical protein